MVIGFCGVNSRELYSNVFATENKLNAKSKTPLLAELTPNNFCSMLILEIKRAISGKSHVHLVEFVERRAGLMVALYLRP